MVAFEFLSFPKCFFPPLNPWFQSTWKRLLGWLRWEHHQQYKRTCLKSQFYSFWAQRIEKWDSYTSSHSHEVTVERTWIAAMLATRCLKIKNQIFSCCVYTLPYLDRFLTTRPPSPKVARSSRAVSSDFDVGEKVLYSASRHDCQSVRCHGHDLKLQAHLTSLQTPNELPNEMCVTLLLSAWRWSLTHPASVAEWRKSMVERCTRQGRVVPK